MKLFDRLGIAPQRSSSPPPASAPAYGRPPVHPSADLTRIIGLPCRDLAAAWSPADVEALEARMRRTPALCVCAAQGRPCPLHFKLVQAQALLEAPEANGLVAPIGVGHGKTLVDLLLAMVMPGCKTAVLLIPANLRTQLLERDLPYYGGHWKLPNIAGGQWFVPGRPVLHVLTYNKLSTQVGTDLLGRIVPDLVICDEAHNLKARGASRTGRFLRYLSKHPSTRLCVLSGTIAARSIKDYSHLADLSLKEASPLPRHWPTVEEWSTALDPGEVIAPPGALQRLCDPGEHVRDAFRRRRNETRGVVSTSEAAIGTSLVIRKRNPGPVPPELLNHLNTAHRGMRPDKEELVEQLQITQCARQLCVGFYHFWRYPWTAADKDGDEAREKLIKKWFARRQDFNREMREKLSRPREHLDSPGLLVKAAIRYYSDPPYEGDKPTWAAETWPAWYEIHNQVQHVTATKWLSDFVVKDAAAWAKETIGIVWVEFPELGEKIAQAAGIPWYGGGPDANRSIALETGKHSIVASIKAHATGKNLQMFCRNLVVTPPSDGATWQQLIAREHRPGQLADEVEVEVYQHTEDYCDAFMKAREYARFIAQTDGDPQRLLIANYEWAD